jgi:lipopolysaccharide/colanic/teichoic acid biosynthesis glycosyltransferase
MNPWTQSVLRRRVKRAMDVTVAGAGLAALSPALAALGLLELVFHGWPPLFTQARPGLNGEPFRMVKLRTMSDARDEEGELLPDAARLTRFGRFLRATSLDELPELYNVLRGDMSLVGPRPLLMQYLGRYSEAQTRRHAMPPGITGWAQIHGRNAITWEQKFDFDVWYVDNWSLQLDCKILLGTLWTVLKREGIAAAGEVTMTEFMGSAEARAADERT